MDAYLQPHMKVFEWGGGGSSVWFSKRASKVVTIEHQHDWAEALIALGRLNMVVLEIPAVYPDFEAYAAGIDNKGLFDLILIDGADGYDLGYVGSRIACAKRAIDHVKPGGVIVIDNAGSASNIEAANIVERKYPDRRKHIGIVLEPKGRSEEKTETSIFVCL
jgi:predicted O-methyltransferase YrrM